MKDFDSFKIQYAETMMYFQTIEHDIKIIFAYMRDGKVKDNYACIAKNPLVLL